MPKPKNTDAEPLSMEPQAVTMKRETAPSVQPSRDELRAEARVELNTFSNSQNHAMTPSSGQIPSNTLPKAASPEYLSNEQKTPYDGGKTILPGGLEWEFAWKPNRSRREMEPVEKLADDADKYKEDMIVFECTEGGPAVLSSAEEVMMLATSVPGPQFLFDNERYFIYQSGTGITWEDASFYKCGSIKFEQNTTELMKNTQTGTEFWITIAAMATCGQFKDISEKYDIRGLRITRKKAVVVEFWLGHKDRKFVDGKQKANLADVVENITTDDLETFLQATKGFLETELPSIRPDRWSIQKFFTEE